MKLGFSFNGIASKHTNAAGLGPEDQRHQFWKLGFQGKKTLFSIFFYYQGPVAVGILAEKSTITGNYYSKIVLPKAVQKMENLRPITGTHNVLIHHDNASLKKGGRPRPT